MRRRAGGGIPLKKKRANVTRVSSACIAVRRTNAEVRAFASTSAVTILMWLSSGILSSLGQNHFEKINFRSVFMTNTLAVIVVGTLGNLLTLVAVPYVRIR